MKLSFNKRAVAVALSLALATPIISTTAIPTINVFAGGFATNPAVAQGHAIPNTDAITISGNTVNVALEGTGVSDAVKASTVVDIYPDSRSSSPAAVFTNLPLTWTGSSGAWTGFSFQLPANWQTRFHNSEQMGIKVTSTVGTSTFSAMANEIVNNDTQISVEFPTAGATTLSAKVTGGSLYNNSVAQSLNDYTYEYTVAPQTSGSVTTAMANSIFNASANIVALSNASATADALGNFTLNLPAGKSIQNLSANDAIYVRRKAKHSNAQYIFIINSVRSAAQTPATPSNPRAATPSNPRPATSSNTVVNPTTPEKKKTDVIIATNSNSRYRSSGGGSSSGSGSRRSVNGSSYSSPVTTTPAQTPATPASNWNSQNTAGNVTRVPAPQGPSLNKQTKSRFSVPKTADASDIARNVIVLFGSVVGMAFAKIGLKKKED